MARTSSTMLELGTPAPDFDLLEPSSGRRIRRDDFSARKALLVVFMCNHCPYVKHLKSALAQLARDFASQDFAMVAINSNDAKAYPDDDPAHMIRDAETFGYTFPYLYDESQEVARAYQAACTPDFFLFDTHRHLVYRGQFDDSRPNNGKPVTGTDLRAAIDATLVDRPVSTDQQPSLGCNIKWREN